MKFVDTDGNNHCMPPYAERIMNARASCTYGTSQNVRKNISNNVRTDTWGIYGIRGGTVISIQRVNPEFPMDDPSQPVYGNNIIIQDVDGTFARYAHLDRIDVNKGDWVGEGSQIGQMGSTGNGDPGPNKHLHVSVYPSWAIKDVYGFMSKNAITNPASYIKSGTYPCNTEISTPYKWPIGKTKYLHEGTDFSGLYVRLIKDWQKGLLGKETIDAQK